MRIAIIRQAPYPDDPRVLKQAQAVANAGHEVTVFCLWRTGDSRDETRDGIRIRRLAAVGRPRTSSEYILYYGIFALRAFAALTRAHAERRFDIVQVNTMPDLLAFAAIVPKFCGSRIVVDFHEAMPELFASHMSSKSAPVRGLLLACEWAALRFADKRITVSRSLADVFASRGAKCRDFIIIRNSPSDGLFPLTLAESIKPKRAGGVFRIVSHGTFARRYGFEVLVNALGRLRAKGVQFRATLVGDGPELESIRHLVRELGLGDHIELTGRVPLDRIPTLLEGSDVGVVPLEEDEFTKLMQPNKLFEYVCLGIPVIASDLPGMREVFDDRGVLFVPPGDVDGLAHGLVNVLNDRDKASARARTALLGADEWGWASQRRAYLKAVLEGCQG